jgi:hypothetical protein
VSINLQSGLSGASTGAVIGSIFPGAGTVIGGIVGGLIGMFSGSGQATMEDIFADNPELKLAMEQAASIRMDSVQKLELLDGLMTSIFSDERDQRGKDESEQRGMVESISKIINANMEQLGSFDPSGIGGLGFLKHIAAKGEGLIPVHGDRWGVEKKMQISNMMRSLGIDAAQAEGGVRNNILANRANIGMNVGNEMAMSGMLIPQQNIIAEAGGDSMKAFIETITGDSMANSIKSILGDDSNINLTDPQIPLGDLRGSGYQSTGGFQGFVPNFDIPEFD